jgi:hypothetical protein
MWILGPAVIAGALVRIECRGGTGGSDGDERIFCWWGNVNASNFPCSWKRISQDCGTEHVPSLR